MTSAPDYGTCRSYDPATGRLTLALDDGRVEDAAAGAVERGGLMAVRPGQRLRLERGADGRIGAVRIPSAGDET